MDSTMSFRRIWESMSLPPNEESTTISPVTGTNAYLTKSYDGSMGLYLRDITDQLPRRRYMHLEISMLREKEVRLSGGRVKRLRNLLFLDADRSVKSPALALILEGLHDHSETGEFTASEMISVLDEVEELLRRPRGLPTIEEVAGAWGEWNPGVLMGRTLGNITLVAVFLERLHDDHVQITAQRLPQTVPVGFTMTGDDRRLFAERTQTHAWTERRLLANDPLQLGVASFPKPLAVKGGRAGEQLVQQHAQ